MRTVSERKRSRIIVHIAGQDAAQRASRRDEALPVTLTVKSFGAGQLVGVEHREPRHGRGVVRPKPPDVYHIRRYRNMCITTQLPVSLFDHGFDGNETSASISKRKPLLQELWSGVQADCGVE